MSEQAKDVLIGFASPATAPLSTLPPPSSDTPGAVPMPMFTAPEQAIPLELLAPQPPPAHDPNQPLVTVDPQTSTTTTWTPDQPLGDWTDPIVDPGQLPPPTGAPITASMPALPQAPAVHQQTRLPQQMPAQQWAPPGFPPRTQPPPAAMTDPRQGWAPNAPGGWVPPQQTPRQPSSPLGLVITAGVTLGIGLVLPWIGVIALAGIAVGALAIKASGRYVALFCAFIACYLSWRFSLGYVAPSVWENSVRWLCIVVIIFMTLLHLQVRLQTRRSP